ncbi:MAG: beta-glycosidase [Gemmatimonadales bacterium]|nr:beta-glycosidase [Gemmatimonadales bacterium]NIR00086.1 beta-glycosidase [Gemmatimonadales bacterium]
MNIRASILSRFTILQYPKYPTCLALLVCLGAGVLSSSCSSSDQTYTRGLGIYPGAADQDFSPALYVDDANYHNLAFRRPAYHSSSYDYNLTAQLVTDGIIETEMPKWISVSTSTHGVMAKNERERLLDHNETSTVELEGSDVWVQIQMEGGEDAPKIDSVDVGFRMRTTERQVPGWQYTVSGSHDGLEWDVLGVDRGSDLPGSQRPLPPLMQGPPSADMPPIPPAVVAAFRQRFMRTRVGSVSVSLPTASQYRFVRVALNAPAADSWAIEDASFFHEGTQVELAPSYSFSSAWKSAGDQEEWIYIDLGAVCTFDKINLSWLRRPAAGAIQVANETDSWTDIYDLSPDTSLTDEIAFDTPIEARYVRLMLTQPATADGYLLSEMEVWGRGGPVPRPARANPNVENNRLDLAGGAWAVERASLVEASGALLSQTGYDDDGWVPATVPGTILVSYLNIGALPDPNYGDNQLQISESFFNSDFWYRNEFAVPASAEGRHTFLNFDGINWKAQVYVNGEYVGRIDGAFKRGKFDISDLVAPGQENALAVLIEKNAHPGVVKEQTLESPDVNGGVLGADNPTFHASIGWDWMPTIRGRNTGIWNDVYLSFTGPVTLEDPFVTTDLPLPDTTAADVNIAVTLRNHEASPVEGTLSGSFGDVDFEMPVSLTASEVKQVSLNASTHPQLRLQNPALWWPNGYGSPNLYDVTLAFETYETGLSDSKSLKTGVREMSYDESSGALKMWINGRRFVGRGGNWGFSESMLRYRAREYDAAVRFHKDMNFTMIRNWVGQTADEEFYEAADRHGIMVWQDFWLANPVDGPDPYDNAMFMDNVDDYVKRIRNHPSIALYCGRNEGNPPAVLDTAIRELLPEIHPGSHYISHSSMGPVSGFGPYGRMPVEFYFERRATPKMHSELGMPNIVTYESLQRMMPDSMQWPIGDMWGLHDFCLDGNVRARSYLELFDQQFGEVENVKDWISLAQFMNYDGHRAMYEAQGKNRMGLVIWMSHPAWPSFVWQTYDYYLEPTAGYFGAKKASEPLHIQWNAFTDSVEVVNYSAGKRDQLTARAELLTMDGSAVWQKNATLSLAEDSIAPLFEMEYPENLTGVHFIRLELEHAGELVSENFYWRGLEGDNYRALRTLPTVELTSSTSTHRDGDRWYLTTTLGNETDHPALMVRLMVVRGNSGDVIAPVLYSDNYVSLMPGEQKTIRMELQHADTRGERPQVVVSGFNVERLL